MVIENKFNIGDIVYLKTDKDQSPRMVFALVVRQGGILYEVAAGVNTSSHYDFELSAEANVLMTTTN